MDKMREFMGSGPVGFRDKEWSEFYEYAKDKGDPSKIYYEDYVAKLTGFVDRHVEGIYAPTRQQ